MTSAQEDLNSRDEVLEGFSKKYVAEIATKESLQRSFNKFIGLHTDVNSKNRLIVAGYKGKTENKEQALQNMADYAVIVGNAVFSVGRDKKDADMQQRANVVPSYFTSKTRDTDKVTKAKDILSLANLNIADVAGENVTPEILLDFEASIAEFENFSQTKDLGQKAVQAANKEIDGIFSQISEVIRKELDKKMYSFKKTNPVMYDEYLLAKKVWTTGVRHKETTPEEQPTETKPAEPVS